MQALPPIPGVVKVVLVHTIGADHNAINRLYFAFSGATPTAALLNGFASTVGTQWNAHLAALAANGTSLTSVTVLDLSSATAAQGSSGTVYAGTRGAATFDSSTCALTTWPIGRRYRGGHPRTYWPFGISTDLLNAGAWTPAFQTAVNSGVQAFIGGILSGGWTGATINNHMNIGYYHGHTWAQNQYGAWKKIPTLLSTPNQDVLGLANCTPTPANQRRRLRPG